MASLKVFVPHFISIPIAASLLAAVLGAACSLVTTNDVKNQGVSDDQILFGQSAVVTGPAQELGKGMRLGIETAFYEVNQSGGIHGRQLKLKTLDDRYEPDYAADTTEWLIEEERVFALIGAVGTPTSRVASPIAHDAGVPFLAPFTGAEFLRAPDLDTVINVRASYYQETEEMVARLTEHFGASRIAVLYQDDSFGWNGLEGVRLALARRGLEPVAAEPYERNTAVGREASAAIVAANPEGVIIIGPHEPVAETVKSVRKSIDPVFMTVSFGGGNALLKALGKDGAGVYVTQVVPSPADASVPLVGRYQAALAQYSPQADPDFVSLEGYLAGRVAIFGLESCGPAVGRQCFVDGLRNSGVIDIEGFKLAYGPGDNQGSDSIFLTVVGADGKYHRVDKPEQAH